MARNAILAGVALVVVGIVVTIASDSESVTSLIPAFIGAVFVVLGLLARAKPDLNHHVMHAAAGLALLGVLGSLGSAVGRGSEGSIGVGIAPQQVVEPDHRHRPVGMTQVGGLVDQQTEAGARVDAFDLGDADSAPMLPVAQCREPVRRRRKER